MAQPTYSIDQFVVDLSRQWAPEDLFVAINDDDGESLSLLQESSSPKHPS